MIVRTILLAAAGLLAVSLSAAARPPAVHDLAPSIELVRSTSKTVHTGPRGGRYYVNRNGKKTYCGRKNPRC